MAQRLRRNILLFYWHTPLNYLLTNRDLNTTLEEERLSASEKEVLYTLAVCEQKTMSGVDFNDNKKRGHLFLIHVSTSLS
jgi:hypothetical protein